MRPIKILLHGYFGYGNLGDEAICSVLLEELKGRCNVKVIILSANPTRTTKLHHTKSCREKLTSMELIRQLLTSHVLVFAGGGRYGEATITRMCLLTLLAKLLGKRVEFRAVGMYPYSWEAYPIIGATLRPFGSLLTRVLLMLSLKLADRITTRDAFSREIFRLSYIKRGYEIEGDLALKLKASSSKNTIKVLLNYGVDVDDGRPLIGLNVRTMHPKVNKKVLESVPRVLDWIIENFNAKIIFIPFGYGSSPERYFDDDLIVARAIKELMNYRSELKIIEEEHDPSDVLGLFRFLDLFIGMRFHSLIFSEIMGVPTVAIIYDTKIEEFLKNGKHNMVGIQFDDLNEDTFKKAIKSLCDPVRCNQ